MSSLQGKGKEVCVTPLKAVAAVRLTHVDATASHFPGLGQSRTGQNTGTGCPWHVVYGLEDVLQGWLAPHPTGIDESTTYRTACAFSAVFFFFFFLLDIIWTHIHSDDLVAS